MAPREDWRLWGLLGSVGVAALGIVALNLGGRHPSAAVLVGVAVFVGLYLAVVVD